MNQIPPASEPALERGSTATAQDSVSEYECVHEDKSRIHRNTEPKGTFFTKSIGRFLKVLYVASPGTLR